MRLIGSLADLRYVIAVRQRLASPEEEQVTRWLECLEQVCESEVYDPDVLAHAFATLQANLADEEAAKERAEAEATEHEERADELKARVEVLEADARDAESPVRMGDVRAVEAHVTRMAERTEAALSLRLTELEMVIRRATAKAPRKKRET